MKKTCTQCRVTKKLTEFYKQAKGKDGTTAECKECRKQRSLEQTALKRRRKLMSTIDRYDLGWPVAPSVAASYSKVNKPATIERIREALEKCGIQSEHAVKAIMEIIEDERR